MCSFAANDGLVGCQPSASGAALVSARIAAKRCTALLPLMDASTSGGSDSGCSDGASARSAVEAGACHRSPRESSDSSNRAIVINSSCGMACGAGAQCIESRSSAGSAHPAGPPVSSPA
eukprot:scaffold4229_cov30-Tisochrysis_lutea.AAC.8